MKPISAEKSGSWSLSSLQQEAYEKLRSFVLHSDQYPKAAVIHGPPGCGKSALCRRFAEDHEYDVRVLGFKQLADDDSGVVENTIMHIFRTCTAQTSKGTAIIIDEVDIWAPNRVKSAWALRLIGALSDALEELREEKSRSVLLLTTCCTLSDVHHSLVRRGKLGCTVGLSALSFDDRTELCYQWMLRMRGGGADLDWCRNEAVNMASVTPGFMLADMMTLLWRLEDGFARNGSNIEGEEIVCGSGETEDMMTNWRAFKETVAVVRPSLLAANSDMVRDTLHVRKLYSDNREEDEVLYGLNTAVKYLEDCLRSVFSDNSKMVSEGARQSARALHSIGAFRGVLIHGPSGCGKTALLKQVCGKLTTDRVNVLVVDSTSVVSSVVGEAERKMCHIFWLARTLAPSLLVLENIDNVAPNRRDSTLPSSSGAAFNRLLSTLLVEIDGVSSNEQIGKVLVVATTRDASLVDDALLRAGRLDVHVAVKAPDAAAREAIFRAACKQAGVTATEEQRRTVRGTPMTSAAHIRHFAASLRRRNQRAKT